MLGNIKILCLKQHIIFKKRSNPDETDILIHTEYSKDVLEQVLEVLDGKRLLNRYIKVDVDLIEIVREFYPEYEPIDTFEEDDEEYDEFYDYYEPEEPKKKGPNYQKPFDFEEAERLLDEMDDAYDRALRCEIYGE
jgi:hypothetical protein